MLDPQAEHRAAWQENLKTRCTPRAINAQQQGAPAEHDFFMALSTLLDLGVAGIGTITPTIPTAYRDEWDMFVEYLKQQPPQ